MEREAEEGCNWVEERDKKRERERERERERRGKKVARTPVARQRLSISLSSHVLDALAYILRMHLRNAEFLITCDSRTRAIAADFSHAECTQGVTFQTS
jgi:hypothetical protein